MMNFWKNTTILLIYFTLLWINPINALSAEIVTGTSVTKQESEKNEDNERPEKTALTTRIPKQTKQNKAEFGKEYVDEAISQFQLSQEKQSLSNREKTFDNLTKTLSYFVACFSLFTMMVLAVAGFLGIRELSSIRKSVDEDSAAFKKHATEHVDELLSEPRVEKLINKTMASRYGQSINKLLERLNKLERHAQDVSDAVRGGYPPPDFRADEPTVLPEETANTFDEK